MALKSKGPMLYGLLFWLVLFLAALFLRGVVVSPMAKVEILGCKLATISVE